MSDFLKLEHDERLGDSETLNFEIPATSAKAFLLAPDFELEWNGRAFYVAEIEDVRKLSQVTKRVECFAMWYRLGQIVVPGSFVLSGVTPAAGLAAILDGSGWSPSVATSGSATTYSLEEQDSTVLALVRSWAKVTGLDVAFSTIEREVTIAAIVGDETGIGFRYRRNLRSMRRRISPPEATRLYAYGADDLTISGVNGGVEYVEDLTYYTDQGISEAVARSLYGRSVVWSDTSFLVDTTLLAAATAELAKLSQPRVSYECDVVDISEISGISENVKVGDVVRVTDPDFGHDLRATVVRYLRNDLEPWRNEIELAFLPNLLRDSGNTSRPSTSASWEQFVGPIKADYEIRNDGRYVTNRIPLRFREGGKAHFHVDIRATGVNAGVMLVEVYDQENAETVFRSLEVPYTDAEDVQAVISFAVTDRLGSYDYRVRVTTTATGGPDPAKGVDIAPDPDGTHSFWIMASGAVQESPTDANSITYNYTRTLQQFTVPDDVEEVTFEVVGSKGRGTGTSEGGYGGRVKATFAVVPGTTYDVWVSGTSGADSSAGWPNGGTPGTANNIGKKGGGSSSICPAAASFDAGFASSILVAGGGGGGSDSFYNIGTGGDSRFYTADNAATGSCQGATQTAGGSGSNENGDTDGQGYGGDGQDSGATPQAEGGGGGGGWHGGGGSTNDVGSGGGGGGSGYIDLALSPWNIEISDAFNAAEAGYIVASWESPI